MQKLTTFVVFFVVLAFALSFTACGGTSVELSDDWNIPSKVIQVKWKASSDLQKKDAWIGVVTADTAPDAEITHDNDDLSWKPLAGKSSGKWDMKCPNRSAKYEVRIYDSEEDGKVLASAPFTVSNSLK